MATLNTRGVIINEWLKVNYSSHFPPPAGYEERLIASVLAARRNVDATIQILEKFIQDSESHKTEEFLTAAFIRHFKLELKSSSPSTQVMQHYSDELRGHLILIKKNFTLISLGLNGQITISDAIADAIKSVVQQLQDPTKPPQPVAQLLDQKMANPRNAKVIPGKVQQADSQARGYVGIKHAKEQELRNQPVPEGLAKDWYANDLSVKLTPDDFGSIHIAFAMLEQGKTTKAALSSSIIHESSHKFVHTRDFAYSSKPEYDTMSAEHALMNADSYALFALSMYYHHCFNSKSNLQTVQGGIDLEK